jgi:Zn finger protein HypA/HybF involved in hydrogenase expression
MIWCPTCTEREGKNFFYYSTEGNFSNHCPKCGSLLTKRKCVRCGHEWTPRNRNALTAVCPKCASPFWCRERLLNKEDKQ